MMFLVFLIIIQLHYMKQFKNVYILILKKEYQLRNYFQYHKFLIIILKKNLE